MVNKIFWITGEWHYVKITPVIKMNPCIYSISYQIKHNYEKIYVFFLGKVCQKSKFKSVCNCQ